MCPPPNMSHLFVAVCVIGCLYAVHAIEQKPDVFVKSDVDPTTLSNIDLIRVAFQKFFNSLDTFDEVQIQKLREYMCDNFNLLKTKLVLAQKHTEAAAIRRDVCFELPLKDLVKLGYRHSLRLLDFMTEQEIKEWRELTIKFVKDQTPDMEYYLETGHETLVVRPLDNLREQSEILSVRITRDAEVAEPTIKELLVDVARKLFSLRGGSWTVKKHMISRLIMRADKELIKINKKVVDEMVDRTPYEELYSLPLRKITIEALYRIEALIENGWEDKTSPLRNALVNFVKVADKKIAKLNDQN